MRPMRLRYWLTGAFALVAIIPIALLGIWIEETALQKEFDAVEEKHLLLAENITAALERYSADTRAALEMFADVPQSAETQKRLATFAEALGFRHFCIVDADGAVLHDFMPADENQTSIDAALIGEVLQQAGPEVTFLPVKADAAGRPTILLTRATDDGGAAVGALSTDYIVHLGEMIDFGNKGHAAIVDQAGRVLAHPKSDWIAERRDISMVAPVKKMMQGETGVTRFFSPAAKKEMISGYTVVPQTGWGVMVPQPVSELEEQARDVQTLAMVVLFGGVVAATLLAWAAASAVTRPLEKAVAAASEIGGGVYDARVPCPQAWAPEEVKTLTRELNRMAESIEEAHGETERSMRELRRANRAKSDFLANTSHELRTPLNAIVGFTEILDRELHGPLGDRKYRENTKNILVSARLLIDVIEDILDLSKLEAGKFTIVDSEFSVRQVVDEAVLLVGDDLAKAGLTLVLELPDNLPYLRSSRSKCKQVVLNLLTNAIKFTDKGGRIVVTGMLENDGGLAIRVADTGIGMTTEQIKTALTPFGQVEDPFNRSHRGVGLGLPLAKRLMEVHGGRLEVESKPGEGTIISVHFPPERVIQVSV